MKQMSLLLFFAFALTGINFSQAQVITGRIVDEKNDPLPYATVVLYDQDSTFVSGVVTDSLGLFRFDYDKLPFLLEVQHISYVKTKQLYHTPICGDITIRERSEMLDGVVVTGNRPIVTMGRSGELVYSVSAIKSRYIANTAYDLIKKLPGVMEAANGSLSLIGASGLKIVINGRQSSMDLEQLYALLRSLPAERVTSLKVMYNPPPKYQTRGAVIDVVLSKAIKFQGEVHGEYQSKYSNSWKSGGSITFPWKKVGVDFSYEFASLGKQTEISLDGIHNQKEKDYSINQRQSILGRENNHRVRIGFDISLDKSSLNMAYNGSFSPKSNSVALSNGNFLSSRNLKNGEDNTHNLSLQYQHDNGWNVDVDYTSYKLNQTQSISYKRSDSNDAFDVSSSQKVDRLLVSLDKDFSIGNSITINTGSSYAISESKDNSSYKTTQGTSYKEDTKFKLTEQVYSVYAGIEKSFNERLTATAYLTAEYYQRDDIKKWLLFPQGSLTYIASANHIFQATFSSEKIYPSFWEMQNTINYIDGYSEIHGNPTLLPMQRYHGTLMYMLKQKYIAQLFYTYNDNFFKQSAYQDPSQLKMIYESKNWDYERMMGLNLIIPIQFWNPLNHRLTLVFSNTDISSKDFYSQNIHRSKWVGLIQLDNSITLSSSPNISIELSGYYQTPAIQTTYDLGTSWACNMGFRYTSPSKLLSVSLIGNDLFETAVPKATAKWGTQNFTIDTGYKTRSFILRLSYNFGGYKKKEYKTVDTSRFGF